MNKPTHLSDGEPLSHHIPVPRFRKEGAGGDITLVHLQSPSLPWGAQLGAGSGQLHHYFQLPGCIVAMGEPQ